MPFDPDTYLGEDLTQPVEQGFSPDEYLADEVAPEVEQAQPEQPIEELDPDRNPYLDPYIGIGETAKSVATGVTGSIAGGWAGLLSSPFVGADEAAEISKGIQQTFAEFGQPETAQGVKGIETLGDLIETGVDLTRVPISGVAGISEMVAGKDITEAVDTLESIKDVGVGKTAGNKAFEVTGDPLWSTAAEMTPEILTSLIPITRMAKSRTALRSKIADKIKAGTSDSKVVNYMVDGAGKLKADKVATEAIKQGFDQGVVAAVKGASKADRVKMKKMIEVMKKGKTDALYAMKNRPSDVAGNSLVERINYVKKVNVDAGKKLDTVAKSLKGKPGNFDKPISQFVDDLDEMGITLDKKLNPVFAGSDIDGLKGPQAAIQNMIKRMSRGGKPDAYDIHRMKKYIDEQVTYGKSAEGLAGKTERVLKKLRRNLDESLDTQYPAYNKVNTTYSDTINALDSIQDVAGKKMDLFGANADKATGTLLRRMMSNAQSRVNLVDSVDTLESVAKKYGSTFNDDIASQMLFVDELNTRFGPVAKTSLAGETVKAGKKVAADVATGRSFSEMAVQAGGKVADKLSGVSDDAAIESMMKLLSR